MHFLRNFDVELFKNGRIGLARLLETFSAFFEVAAQFLDRTFDAQGDLTGLLIPR